MIPPFFGGISAAMRRGRKGLWVLLAAAALLMGAVLPAQADPLANWHWRNPTPQGNYLFGAVYGSGKYVAVGDCGTILASPNGADWTIVNSNPDYDLSGVTYGLNGSNNPLFVAVGSDHATGNTPVIMTSTDGTNWSSATVPAGPEGLDGVTCDDGTFLAVSWNGYICYSHDGSNWTSRLLSSACVLKGAAFGNGTFVAVGVDNSQASVIWTATDPGSQWTLQTGGASPRTTLAGICYAADSGAFVAVGYNNSTDKGVILASGNKGVAWDVYNQPATGAYSTTYDFLEGVAYGNGTFVAVGYDGRSGGLTLTAASPGDLWGSHPSSYTAFDCYLCGVAWGEGLFVAVGDYGELVTSQDGYAWSTPVEGPAPDFGLLPQIELTGTASDGKDTCVAVGYNPAGNTTGTILTSTDGGTTWTNYAGDLAGETICGVAYGNNTFVTVGYHSDSGATVMTSRDGLTWTSSHPSPAYMLTGVTYGNGTFVAVGVDGYENPVILTCPDPASSDWTVNSQNNQTLPGELNAVAYGDNAFVAVGNSGTVWACGADPTVPWTVYNSGHDPCNLMGVAFGQPGGVPTFVAVGLVSDPGGWVQTSTDGGADWSAPQSGTASDQLFAVTSDGETFVAVGDGGTVLTSANPGDSWDDWASRASGTNYYRLDGVTYLGGPFLVVGSSATILQSDGMKPAGKPSAPTINPPAGTYTAPLQVTISNPNPDPGDEPVYYTTDGSQPSTGSPSFTGSSDSLTLNQSATVTAAVYDESTLTWSDTTSVSYTITAPSPGRPLPPAIEPDGGTYTAGRTVSVTITNPNPDTTDQSVYYTTDGSPPDHAAADYYGGQFGLSRTTTVRAVVYDQIMGTNSDEATATFTFNQPSSTGGGGSPAVPALTVAPSSYTVDAGDTEQFTATFYANGQGAGGGQDVTRTCTWSSTDPVIATVNAAGLATGVEPGTAGIEAVYGGQTAKAALTVLPAVPPASSTLPEGALLDRKAGAVFAGGGQVTGGIPDGMLTTSDAGPTITIPINTSPPGPDYTIQIYHWQAGTLPGSDFPGRWVALATTMQAGKAVAVNDGNYTGWFAAWWVVKPNLTDVAGHWAADDINRMNGLGLVEGYPGEGAGLGRPFEADRSITRAEFTTILARILAVAPRDTLKPLSDAAADAALQKDFADAIPGWARPYVAAMAQAGYVRGIQGDFEAAAPITRMQVGVIVSRFLTAAGYSVPADISQFRDAAQIPAWADGGLARGVMEGSGGLLRPNDPITRAEACTVLLRLVRDLGY